MFDIRVEIDDDIEDDYIIWSIEEKNDLFSWLMEKAVDNRNILFNDTYEVIDIRHWDDGSI